MRIFVASPMEPQPHYRLASFEMNRLLLEAYGENSVFMACLVYPNPKRCLPPRAAFDASALQIREADYFVLFSPEGPPFGSLIEVGLALAWEKPVLGIFSHAQHLPYILRHGTNTMTHILCPRGVSAEELGKTCFGFIRAFIDVHRLSDGLTPEEARQQLEGRLPALAELQKLEGTTQELLKRS